MPTAEFDRTRRPARRARPRRGRRRVASPARRRAAHVAPYDRGLRPRRAAVPRLPRRAVRRAAVDRRFHRLRARQTCAPFSPAAGRRASTGARCSARSRRLRSLARHIAREGGEPASALGAVRAPKAPRRLPRPLAPADARAVATTAPREGEAREPWVLARDAAVLALCYGAGLRISRGAVDPPRRRADRRGRDGHGRRQGQEDARRRRSSRRCARRSRTISRSAPMR